jgi:hypothetical protein
VLIGQSRFADLEFVASAPSIVSSSSLAPKVDQDDVIPTENVDVRVHSLRTLRTTLSTDAVMKRVLLG